MRTFLGAAAAAVLTLSDRGDDARRCHASRQPPA